MSIHIVDGVLPQSLNRLICEKRWGNTAPEDREYPDNEEFMRHCIREDTLAGCDCCFDIFSEQVRDEALITLSDIDSVDWQQQVYYLDPDAYKRIESGLVPDYGMPEISDSTLMSFGIPAVLKLDGMPVYILWFMPLWTSNGCDLVMVNLWVQRKVPRMTTRFGIEVADYQFGIDPRFDERIYQLLVSSGKITLPKKENEGD